MLLEIFKYGLFLSNSIFIRRIKDNNIFLVIVDKTMFNTNKNVLIINSAFNNQ